MFMEEPSTTAVNEQTVEAPAVNEQQAPEVPQEEQAQDATPSVDVETIEHFKKKLGDQGNELGQARKELDQYKGFMETMQNAFQQNQEASQFEGMSEQEVTIAKQQQSLQQTEQEAKKALYELEQQRELSNLAQEYGQENVDKHREKMANLYDQLPEEVQHSVPYEIAYKAVAFDAMSSNAKEEGKQEALASLEGKRTASTPAPSGAPSQQVTPSTGSSFDKMMAAYQQAQEKHQQ